MELSVYNNGSDDKCFVFGHQFGPGFIALADCIEDAIDEWDERHGQRVDYEADAATLRDYGPTDEEAIDKAMCDGDIRINSGGTTVWVDHYEWVREFDSIAAAFAFAFGVSDT